jgi:hypothetical protein
MLVEIVSIAHETGSKPVGLCALDVSAGLGASQGDWQNAARFFGAAQAQVVETGFQRDPTDEAFLLPLIKRAREALGEAAFESCERDGRVLNYEQGIDEARHWLGRAS